MRCQIIAELATNHGGDLELAEDMIHAAAEAGADVVKTQAYQLKHLRKSDPQYDWFRQSELSYETHQQLMSVAESCGVQYLTTAYTVSDLERVKRLGLQSVKIGSGEGGTELVGYASTAFPRVYASLAWGARNDMQRIEGSVIWFSTLPMYPAPVECYARIRRWDGYSDHHIGLDVAKMAIAQGVRYLEKHFHLPGRGRNQDWNMGPEELRELRRWAEVCAQANDGTRFEGRWCA